MMGRALRRLEAAALALVVLFTGSAVLPPAGKAADCDCPVPCARCCCAADAPGSAELCLLGDRDRSAPRSEVPPSSQLRVREAVFVSPALPPHPGLGDRLGIVVYLLPASFALPPEVPPPRVAS